MKVELHSVWGYIGPHPGKDIRHMVIMIKEGIITTWSEFDKNPNNGGFSWNGNEKDFLENFKPLEFSK